MKNIDILLNNISETRNELLNHPIYSKLKSEHAIAKFMETHVFAVWDFMSLVKALQIDLTSVKLPWTPTKDNISRRLINEIVLGEESDIDQEENPTSHYELYLEAMETIGAKTDKIKKFVSNVIEHNDYKLAVSKSDIPNAAVDFMNFTFDVIDTKKTHIIASVFTFGREDLIPDMFIEILKQADSKNTKFNKLTYYLDRHIELDGDEHGPLSLQMVEELCENDPKKIEEVLQVSKEALQYRIALWDGIKEKIVAQEGRVPQAAKSPSKKLKNAIIAVSIVIPLAVAILFSVKIEGFDLSFLPPIYASLNGLTAIGLLSALVAIKFKKIKIHQRIIQLCLSFSILFLLLYVLYHMTSDSTKYGDINGNGILESAEALAVSNTRGVYFFILVSHIFLSLVVIPLVLFTYKFAWEGNYERHKKWTRFAFPIWLYVAITGVVVYYMISPFYS